MDESGVRFTVGPHFRKAQGIGNRLASLGEIPKSRLRRADKNCQRTCKNIGSNCILILEKGNF